MPGDCACLIVLFPLLDKINRSLLRDDNYVSELGKNINSSAT